MAITFVNDLRLSEMATGDNSGTWGNVTNTNLELIGEALGYGTEGITTNADTHTSTIADGSTDPVRALYVEYTGTLDSACTITIGPNTVNKVCFIENGTSGSQNIIISQGSGANVTIPAGDTKAVYLNGAGSGAAVVDAFASLSVVDLKVQDDLTVTDDVAIGGLATIGETLAVTGIATFTDDIIIGDGKTIGSASTVGAITIASDGDTTFSADLNVGANFDVAGNSVTDGTALVTGVLTTTAATVFNGGFASNANSTVGGTLITTGNISINETGADNEKSITIANSSVAGGMIGVEGSSGNRFSGSAVNNMFMGTTTADGIELATNNNVRVNISSAGNATFSHNVLVPDDRAFIMGASSDFQLYHDPDVNIIQAVTSNQDIVFKGNDDGSPITALTLDMSDIGSATFNGSTRAPFGLFGEIYEVTNGADISLTKVSEDSGFAASCRSTTNGHTPYLTFQKTPATSGNYTATASGDFLGLINFKGVNTSGVANEGARIQVVQNGALSGSVPATMIIQASNQDQLHMAANSTSGAAVCIGGTAVSRRLDVRSTNVTTAGFFYQDASDVPLIQLGHSRATGSNTATMIQLQNAAGTEKGSIKTTTSASSFNTSSDYRLKENVNYSWDATTRLKQLKPARFNWIEDDTNTLLDGFMAHEVTSVVPEATDGAKDGVKTVTNTVLNSFGNVLAENVTEADWTAGKIARTDADGNEVAEATYPSDSTWTASKEMPVYQQIDQSKLVPLLVKTILELESRITALEG